MNTGSVVIGVLGAYLLVVLGLGFWASRETRTVKGYFVAGKSYGDDSSHCKYQNRYSGNSRAHLFRHHRAASFRCSFQ